MNCARVLSDWNFHLWFCMYHNLDFYRTNVDTLLSGKESWGSRGYVFKSIDVVLPGRAPVTADSLQHFRLVKACLKEAFRFACEKARLLSTDIRLNAMSIQDFQQQQKTILVARTHEDLGLFSARVVLSSVTPLSDSYDINKYMQDNWRYWRNKLRIATRKHYLVNYHVQTDSSTRIGQLSWRR